MLLIISQDIPKPSAIICQNISRRPQSFLCLASQHPTSRAPTPFSPGCLVAAGHPSSKFEQTQRDLGPIGEQCVTTSDPATLIALRLTVFKTLQKKGHGRNWKLEMPVKFPPENAMSGSKWIQSCIIRLASFKAQFNMGSVASSSPPSSALQSWPPHWHLYCT